jgi:hypothetical protein
MLFFLAFSACKKDSSTDATEYSSESVLYAKNAEPPALYGDGCECQYQIVSVTSSTTPPLGEYLSWNVGTEEQCSGYYSFCNYFNVTEGPCDPQYVPGCSNLLTNGITLPTSWYSFICYLDDFAAFKVFSSYDLIFPITNCGIPSSYPSGNITLKIRCRGSECTEGWYDSGTKTIGFTNGLGSTRANVQLGGCGCEPAVSYDE